MQCHKCPTNLKIQAGTYRDTPWEETPCASCNFTEHGFAIEYDANRDKRPAPDSSALAADIDLLPVSVLPEMAAGLLQLSPPLRDTIARRLAGQSYRQIASADGISIQAAERRHQRALKQWPALRALFARKIKAQQVRKPHKRKTVKPVT